MLNQTPSAFRQLMQAEEESGRGEAEAADGDLWGRGAGVAALRGWYERHGETRAAAGEHVRDHRDDGARDAMRDLDGRHGEGERGSVIGGNIGDLRIYVLDSASGAGGGGSGGRAVCGRSGVARGYLKRGRIDGGTFSC